MVLTEDNKEYLLEQNHNGESTSEKGKPKIFSGAVGNFDFKVHADKKEPKNGESLDLTRV
jgi:hypothetical protein